MSSTSEKCSEMFQCPICLEVFSEPVTIPCGHNFCKNCICEAWPTDGTCICGLSNREHGPCKCPLCNRRYGTRPDISVNYLLSQMVSQFKLEAEKSKSQLSKLGEVSCDVCSAPKLKALKSCLVCLSSFCETHLQSHLTISGLKIHQLMEPVENLEDRICPKHKRPLELFCGTDQRCICILCVLEHKNHELLSLEEACEYKLPSLLHTQAQSQHMVEQRRLKVKQIQRCVELSDTEVHRERAVGLQAFTALMQTIQRFQDRYLEKLQEKQSRSNKLAQELVQQLEQEICELEKSNTEAERLSHSQDPLHFLLRCSALTPPAGLKKWSSVSFETCEGSAARALSELEKHLSEDFQQLFKQLPSRLELPPARLELMRVQQFVVDVTLDPDTANPRLVLAKDLKQVHCGDVEKKLPDSPLRFDPCICVLGKQSFSSGRFYFEVQVKGKTEWDLGVAHESINRKRRIDLSPKNGFWRIMLRNKDKYWARSDSCVRLSVLQVPQKVGVFVDYCEGLVSFYDADSADLLFFFSGCYFRKKLFPYFSPGNNAGGSNIAPLVLTAVETFRDISAKNVTQEGKEMLRVMEKSKT